eukprot:357079-Chlamydomonas_euryale.AAC.5
MGRTCASAPCRASPPWETNAASPPWGVTHWQSIMNIKLELSMVATSTPVAALVGETAVESDMERKVEPRFGFLLFRGDL